MYYYLRIPVFLNRMSGFPLVYRFLMLPVHTAGKAAAM